jgi:hypothetical protein
VDGAAGAGVMLLFKLRQRFCEDEECNKDFLLLE